MSKRDGSAIWVNLCVVQAKVINAEQHLTGEGFVDFVKVDGPFRSADLLEQLWNSICWSDTHDACRNTCLDLHDVFADDR